MYADDGPQLTDIASYLAFVMPEKGVPPDRARESWRSELKQARAEGRLPEVADRVGARVGFDPLVQRMCAALRATGPSEDTEELERFNRR